MVEKEPEALANGTNEETRTESTMHDLEKGSSSQSGSETPEEVNETLPVEPEAAMEPPLNPMDPRAFPDGGLKAWSCVVGGFFALFCSFGWITCIGVFQNYYESHMLSQYSPSTIAWIPSLETFMMLAAGPFVGRLYDTYGPRQLVAVGTFFHVFGLMMTSLCTEFYQFILAQGICSPLGASMIFYPAVSSVSTWFFRRRALATGIVTSGSSLGGVLMPIMVQRLIPQIGFPWTMRALAFLLFGLLLISIATMSSRIPPTKRPFRILDMIEPFGERTFLLLSIAILVSFWGMYPPMTYIILHARSHGMSSSLAQYLVPILNAASVFGRILPGAIGDRFGRYNVMSVVTVFTAIIILALWIPSTSNAPIIIFTALFGFGTGAMVSLPPALVAQISDVQKIGVRVGTVFFTASLGALTGAPIGGAIINHQHGGYQGMQIFSGVTMAAGAAFFILARISLAGVKLKKI